MELSKSLDDRYPVFLVLTDFHKMPFIVLGIIIPIETGAMHLNIKCTQHIRFNQTDTIFEFWLTYSFCCSLNSAMTLSAHKFLINVSKFQSCSNNDLSLKLSKHFVFNAGQLSLCILEDIAVSQWCAHSPQRKDVAVLLTCSGIGRLFSQKCYWQGWSQYPNKQTEDWSEDWKHWKQW